jgi:hypothetical protein
MKRAAWRLTTCAFLALLAIPQGCSSNSSQPPTSSSAPPTDAPRPVTDLSQLAPGNPLAPFGKHEQVIARNVASDKNDDPHRIENLDQLAVVRNAGDDKHPCEQRLLNKKAALFDGMSSHLMNQIFNQMQVLETNEELSHLKLPTDLKWVVISGRMDHKGVLKELVLEQHSGTAAVDRMMIAACKKALYIHNPATDAADANGEYHVRVEARLENFASMDGEHWTFKTYLGIALL